MIVLARGPITDREALAPHREEELRAVAQLKADGVMKAAYRRTPSRGSISFSRDPASTPSDNEWTASPFVVEGLMTVEYEEVNAI
jgi:hypothetical protein